MILGRLLLAAVLGTPVYAAEDAETIANPAAAATGALSLGVGLNWHLNRNIKPSLDYGHTDFKAEDGSPFDGESEDLLLARVQFAF